MARELLGYKDVFNYRHSSPRSIIKRSFRVLKKWIFWNLCQVTSLKHKGIYCRLYDFTPFYRRYKKAIKKLWRVLIRCIYKTLGLKMVLTIGKLTLNIEKLGLMNPDKPKFNLMLNIKALIWASPPFTIIQGPLGVQHFNLQGLCSLGTFKGS